jgi:hypothetical protein
MWNESLVRRHPVAVLGGWTLAYHVERRRVSDLFRVLRMSWVVDGCWLIDVLRCYCSGLQDGRLAVETKLLFQISSSKLFDTSPDN